MSENGKGSAPRPVDRKKLDKNWDLIRWKSKGKKAKKG
jgi:hypothetical protein